ncbi:MAG: MBL fold metallo-hydrolase [Methanospirillum sp.]
MESRRWQPLPGLEEGAIFPFLRKPDVCCSNVYLLDLPGAAVIVDAGADPRQSDELAALVKDLAPDSPPVVLFTHCHVDHVYRAATAPEWGEEMGAEFAAHAIGADVLAAGDVHRTAADIFGLSLPGLDVSRRLFASSVPGSDPLPWEPLAVGGRELGRVYAAPGHTPDHLLLHVGRTLFVGDLLSALEPGVAGLAGFDRDALGRTYRGLDLLLAEGRVETVCPGHGAPLPAGQAAAMVRGLRTQLAALPPIAPFSAERAVATRVVAFELLEEADRLFALIGGRLLALVHHLSVLGEEAAADAIEAALEDDPVEPCLASFNRFADEYLAGRRHGIEFVLKGVQAARRIDAALAKSAFADSADAALLARARRVADDFLAVVTGGRPETFPEAFDLDLAVAARVEALRAPAVPDEEMLAAAEDEAAFRAALIRRLAAPPLLAEVEVGVAVSEGPLPIVADRTRFDDLVDALLEDLVGAGHRRIRIGCGLDAGLPRLAIEGEAAGPPPFGLRRAEAYRRRFGSAGALFEAAGGRSPGAWVSFPPPGGPQPPS